uniref:Cytoskeletal protein binding protein n=2 Tax=Kalmanozyma brasiliensis (strain GHG001) TaxID=1365824 RepID=V5ENW7_KALBG
MDEHDHASDAAEDFYIEGAEDENEFDGDEGDHANVPEGVYKVLYEFDPVSEHELAVQPGDVVHVVGSLEGGWAIAVTNGDEGVKGLVPATYLEWSAPLPE